MRISGWVSSQIERRNHTKLSAARQQTPATSSRSLPLPSRRKKKEKRIESSRGSRCLKLFLAAPPLVEHTNTYMRVSFQSPIQSRFRPDANLKLKT